MTPRRFLVAGCAGASVASLLAYAFFGATWWVPLPEGSEGALRFALLMASHLAPFLVLVWEQT